MKGLLIVLIPNDHIIYEFTFTPDRRLHDSYIKILNIRFERNGTSRPESQMATFKAKYGASIRWKIIGTAPNRVVALTIEQKMVKDYFDVWNAKPREQLRPLP